MIELIRLVKSNEIFFIGQKHGKDEITKIEEIDYEGRIYIYGKSGYLIFILLNCECIIKLKPVDI